MRDALSIMDQAIASAPVEAGRAVLSAAQIRELMGSVPNAVFERLLEAVAAGQSAELMEQLNLLVNAGHSPSSLARQMVRYLRNALMAKLGGEQTELLQISGDERARAARTALLFTEEELTRNLQIVLRTFDDLNYRQEQRFHLELGLLKLIHAQRLLPIEELLSGVAAGSRQPRSACRATASRRLPVRSQAQPPAPRRPRRLASAPAGSLQLRAFAPGASSCPASELQRGHRASHRRPGRRNASAASAQRPSLPPPLRPRATPQAATLTEGAPGQGSGDLAPGAAPRAHHRRRAPRHRLRAGRRRTQLSRATAGHGRVDARRRQPAHRSAGVGKKMLALTVNAAAEKIIRQELQRLGAPARFLVVPGEGAAQAAAPMAAPLAGSIQEAALANPLVQRAQEIFKAEVRSVVDLRQK